MLIAKLVVALAMLGIGLAPSAARANEIDVNGNWFVDLSCGSTPVVVTWNVTEDVATGVTSIVDSDCGSFDSGGTPALMTNCAYSTSPVPGRVTGTSFASPETGTVTRSFTLSPAVPAFACTNPGVGMVSSGFRIDATITDDGAGRSIRMNGTVTIPGSTLFDPDGVPCQTFGATTCTFTALRSDVGVGTDQVSQPREGTTVTFDSVTEPGFVTVTPLGTPSGQIPPNFQLIDSPLYFDVSTTATVSGPITVCLPYPDTNNDGFVDGTTPGIPESSLLLLHEEDGVFVNRTLPDDPPLAPNPDTVNNVICAQTEHLSQFVFGTATTTCGNALVDAGEDCDVGAGLNGAPSSCCTVSCTFRTIGETCRPSEGECDGTTEVCTGSDGACPTNTVVPAGVHCSDDGNDCRRDECNGAGACAHPPVASTTPCADDGNICTYDHCDGAGSCAHPAASEGTSCDDGLTCNGIDRCVLGVCFHADAQCAPPAPLDHYKCHKVKDLKSPPFTSIKDPGISLDDQFGPDPDVAVLKPAMVCNPSDKNGSGISNPTAHLCCYKIKGQKVIPPRKQVVIADQFGTLQLEAVKPALLCQPCTKTPLNF